MPKLRTLFNIFWAFFKIGLFTVGGGYAMIPMIQEEFVNKQKKLTDEELLNYVTIAQSFPGVIAVSTSTCIGNKIAGLKGSIAAIFGVILPSFIIVILFTLVYNYLQSNFIFKIILKVIKVSLISIIFASFLKIFKTAIDNKIKLVIFISTCVLMIIFKIPSINIIFVSFFYAIMHSIFEKK